MTGTEGFLASLRSKPKPHYGPQCSVCGLSAKLKSQIGQARAEGYSWHQILVTLQEVGVKDMTLQRLGHHHRNGHGW